MPINIVKTLVALLITILLQSCKVDTPYFPAPDPRPNDQPKLFGYYASAMNQVGSGDYINEMSGHANLVFIQSGDVATKLQETEQQHLKAIFSFTNMLFDADWRLRSTWKDSIQAVTNLINRYDTSIAAFYVIDEPYGRGWQTGVPTAEMYNAIETVGKYLKQLYPSIPIAVIFSAPELSSGIPFPPSFDWFAVDCYTGFYKCNNSSIPQLYETIDKTIRNLDAQDGKHRQLMAIPPTGYDINTPGAEQNNLNQITEYRKWLHYRHDIHIVLGFIWQSFTGNGDNWRGTRDSEKLLNGYTLFYHDFMNGSL